VRRRLFALGPTAGPDPGRDPGRERAQIPLAERDDVELLALTAQGEAAAFEVLYDRHAGAVYGMVLQVLRDPAQSEEVAQEVLVEAWRTAARYDPARGGARAWLVLMARRRAIDRVRAAQAAGDRDVRVAVSGMTPEYDEVSEAVELRMEAEQVRRCLGGLSQAQRESIDLAFYRGHTHREVADLLGLPLGTVKTRLRDGLIRLRDCLGVG